jgi:hypothetical protein
LPPRVDIRSLFHSNASVMLKIAKLQGLLVLALGALLGD